MVSPSCTVLARGIKRNCRGVPGISLWDKAKVVAGDAVRLVQKEDVAEWAVSLEQRLPWVLLTVARSFTSHVLQTGRGEEGKGQAFEDSPLPVLATTVCGILRLLLPSSRSRLGDPVLLVEGMVSGLLYGATAARVHGGGTCRNRGLLMQLLAR